MVSAAELAIVLKAQDNASKVFDEVGKKGGMLGTALKAGALAGGAAVIGLGATMLKIAGDFDDAFDKIRVGTGATGDTLAGLQGDFKSVFTSVPTDMGSASTAISELNTRLGLSGKPLQDLSKQFLELSRITGTDVKQNITSVTRAFGDWSLSTDDQGKALDTLFKVSQATGPSVDALAMKVVQFGAPMRQMGFSFEETAVLMGQFEKQGVNTELVMGSMRIAIGKFAKDNIPMRKGLEDTIKSIQKMGPSAESTALAMEVFGARAGADMADTILSGKFAIDDWLKSVEGSSETIMSAAADTQDFGEKFTLLKNKILVAVEPLATKMMGALTAFATLLLDRVAPAVSSFINDIVDGFQHLQDEGAASFGEVIGQKIRDFVKLIREDVIPAVKDTLPWFKDLGETALEIGKVVLQQFLIPALIQLGQLWTGLQPVLKAAFDILKPVWQILSDHKEIIIVLAGVILLLNAPWLAVIAVLVLVLAKWDEIKLLFTQTIPGAIDSVISKIRELPVIGEIFDALVHVVADKVEAIVSATRRIIIIALEVIDFFSNVFHGRWGEAWENVKTIATESLGLLLDYLQLTFVGTLKSVLESLKPWEWAEAGFRELKEQASIALDAVVGFFGGLPGRISGALGDVASWFVDIPREAYNAGWDLIEALIRGLRSRVGDISNFVTREIIPKLNPLNWDIPGLSPFEQAFEHAGQIAIEGFAGGMTRSLPDVIAAIYDINKELSLIGEGPERDALKARIEALTQELQDAIKFTLVPSVVETIQQSSKEIRDGIDNDLDGAIDEGLSEVVETITRISAEIRDGIDNDLDGMIDEGLSAVVETISDAAREIANKFDNLRPGLLAAIYQINKDLLTIGEGAVRDQLKMQLAALLKELDEATIEAAGIVAAATPPGGSTSTPPAGSTTPPTPRITQSAATLLRGALSGFSNVPSLGFFEGPLTRGGGFAALIAYLNSQAGQAGQNVSRLLTAIGRASTASGTDLLTLLRSNGLSFHGGGIVPGPIGSEQLVVAQGGERFLGPGQSGGGVTIINNVTAWDSRDVERWFENNADRMASAVERSRGRRMR